MGDRRGANRVLVGKPEERRLLERPRRKWENNIKIDLREVGPEHRLDRSGRWPALVNAVINIHIP
jgi:hypothetical protein